MEIRRGMYGWPQAGILANKLLKNRLAKHGYIEVQCTLGLFRHSFRSVTFTLAVDGFGVKYIGMEHADHLMMALEEEYKIKKNWKG